jgi:predicted nuclease with TOPRIM domain
VIPQHSAVLPEHQRRHVPARAAVSTCLRRERQHKQERIKELVAAVGASPEPVASFTESLQELESAVSQINQRLTELQTELDAVNHTTIDRDDLTAALSAFGPVWEELYLTGKTSIVNLLIERVSYDVRSDKIQISLNAALAPAIRKGYFLSAE